MKLLIFLFFTSAFAETLDDGQCRIHEIDRFGSNIKHYTRGNCDQSFRICEENRGEGNRCSHYMNGYGQFKTVGEKCRFWLVNPKHPHELQDGKYAIEKTCKRALNTCRNWADNYQKCQCRYFELAPSGKWVTQYTRNTCEEAKKSCEKSKLSKNTCSQDTHNPKKISSFRPTKNQCRFLILRNTDNILVGEALGTTCEEAMKKCQAQKTSFHYCEKEEINGCRFALLNDKKSLVGHFTRKNCPRAKAACSTQLNTGLNCIPY